MPRRPALFCVCVLVLTGCAVLPSLDRATRAAPAPVVYPAILPLEGLLAQAGLPVGTDNAPGAALQARAAALDARGAALQGPVIPPAP